MQTLNVLDNRFSSFNTYSTLATGTLESEDYVEDIIEQRQILSFMKKLQTTIDANELISLLATEAKRYIDFSGLYFKSKKLNQTLRGSRKSKAERCFDLKVDNEFIGTISYGINRPISNAGLKVLEQLHQCLLHPIKNAIAYYSAMQLAMHDGLTGLGNRRYFDEQLKRAMHNANRHHSLVGLVLGDLNKFKIINDTYGHAAGDVVLQEFANILRQCTRDSDSSFRFGGDEFAVIVENANDSALLIIEQRINNALENNPILAKYHLGCSLGSTFMSRADNEISFFERADEILYRNKVQSTANLSIV